MEREAVWRVGCVEESDVNGSRSRTKVALLGLSVALLVGFGVAASQTTGDVSVLLLGVVRLNGSGLAISAAQAEQLLPLVEAWRAQLSHSWTVTRGASAVAHAIQAILTSEQLTRIQAMALAPSLWMMRCTCPCEMSPPSGAGMSPPDDSWQAQRHECLHMQQFQLLVLADEVIQILSRWTAAG